MAKIKITIDGPLMDGHHVTFKAPCDCTSVESLNVYYVKNGSQASRLFTMKDAHGNDLTGLGNLFVAGAYVHVILDTNKNAAYLQNADTNGYLEDRINRQFDGEILKPLALELTGGGEHGGYIDFHFGESTEDFTTRVIESAPGCLALQKAGEDGNEILTTRNRPHGSYVGTGSSTKWTANISYISEANALLVWNSTYFSLITPMGAICVTPGGEITSLTANEVKFANGTLDMATTSSFLNAMDTTHYYQVL
jgi:hypothetical protein